MGMFDSLYDANDEEWQTKAFYRRLDVFRIGQALPLVEESTYQVGIIGGPFDGEYIRSFATVRDGVLTEVNVPRVPDLPLLHYGGGWE